MSPAAAALADWAGSWAYVLPHGGAAPTVYQHGLTWKIAVLVAVPAAVVTLIGPSVAPLGTYASRSLSEAITTCGDFTPLNIAETLVAGPSLAKPLPLM